jgi:hypothetical protein
MSIKGRIRQYSCLDASQRLVNLVECPSTSSGLKVPRKMRGAGFVPARIYPPLAEDGGQA